MPSKPSGSPKTTSMTSAPTPASRLARFAPPLLLAGEDPALYDDLAGRMAAAVAPVDFIEELYVADVVSLEWKILRWRRLKFGLLRASLYAELEAFLRQRLEYAAYADDFAEALAETLVKLLPEPAPQELADEATALAQHYARSQPDAVEKVRLRLKAAELDAERILGRAKVHRAEAIVQAHARREPEALKLVDELLASSGRTLDDLLLEALPEKFDDIERIDRLITIAETRRNVSLREIDRRRAVLGEALRRNLDDVEEGQFVVIATTPAEGQSPADGASRTATERTPALETGGCHVIGQSEGTGPA